MPRRTGRPTRHEPAPDDETLLDAALEEFASAGFDGASVRRIARSQGVSHNLIPKRFGSKDELWHRAVDHGFAVLLAGLEAVGENTPTDELQLLQVMIVRFVEVNATRPALMQIVTREATAPGPRFDYLFEHYIAPVRAFGDELLGRLAADGRVRSDSAALVYFFMIHGAGGPFVMPALAGRFGITVDADDDAIHDLATTGASLLLRGLTVHRES